MSDRLNRFLKAQATDYQTALAEIKTGRKQSHWMWYIFPQMQGLGYSSTAKFYAIENREEAIAFFKDPLLGSRLIEISKAALEHKNKTANQIFGSPDDSKLKSCMTLFDTIQSETTVFENVLNQFFAGNKCRRTLDILRQTS